MTTPLNVLISLHRGYGVGDACQMSAVLRHVVAARPHWVVDYVAEEGRHQAGRGIVARTFAWEDDKVVRPLYDAEVQILLYDTWANWDDRPNTRVSSCLHERFGLPWRAEYGRYQVRVDPESVSAVQTLLWGHIGKNSRSLDATRLRSRGQQYVAVHYQGDSSQDRKNLTHEQADRVCHAISALGYAPLILDWRRRCPLPWRRLSVPEHWGRDVEMVCAVISQCRAFIGIDSGPGKCASATDTPTLVTWTGHHPAPFHDPAPNTTHLVPRGYHGLFPVCDDPGVVRWFEANHSVRQYDRDPVPEIADWLKEVLWASSCQLTLT